MSDLTQAAWREKLEKDTEAVIIDVRTDEEVAEGMIPNAEQLDIFQSQVFMEKIQTLDASKNYYIYCRSGGRSAQACAIMNQLGIENAYNLMGGFTEWTGEVIEP
ncbi:MULTISPECIES: rhodanese-like domain-containing protein [Bizionia]|uniref:Rhodanese-like domain-containing protein n=1 Tax=Bizionia algoritergicola TaxID=291187 RepID=A0A5D0QVB3_9FLAO|nr:MULTISPECIES: rhodanese-like domain-containing protein [Bizionia]OBX22894.1 rhodanese [Bizionia sp. APA-3]TYB72795.1 rhodanese-like domain-containing protein [Bizionia algoritergicola]